MRCVGESHPRVMPLGCGSFGCVFMVLYWWLRSALSRAVLALWHAADSHWRLLRLWLSPGVMWSQSVPMPLHSGACCVAWHL